MFTLLIRVGFKTTKPLDIILEYDDYALGGGVIVMLFKGKVKSMIEGSIIVEVTGKGKERLGKLGWSKVLR